MGFVIIEGRDDGYPCIPQLPERSSEHAMTPPLPEGYFTLHAGKYPRPGIYGSDTTVSVSMLVCGEKVPYSLYWNEARITAVYLNDKEKLRYFTL